MVEQLLQRVVDFVGDAILAPEIVNGGAFSVEREQAVVATGATTEPRAGFGFALGSELGKTVFVLCDDLAESGDFLG